MLLTQKAFAEGGRAMIYFAAQYADHMTNGIIENDQKKYDYWDDKLGFFTPILKGFLTEMGLECGQSGHAGVRRPRLHQGTRHGADRP
jgi:alkylation response protein AidB-like acyl-CoA dehydrogenase